MKKAVIVFSFPEPDDNMIMASIIYKSKSVFEDMPNVKVHLAVKDAADGILEILTPSENQPEKIEGA